MSTKIQDAARALIKQGLLPIPIHYKSKKPVEKEWSTLKVTDETVDQYFDKAELNIGVLIQNGVADIDLDTPQAVHAAPFFLPATGMVFGRQTSPRSHWVYLLTEDSKYKKFTDPADKQVLLELRCQRGKQQTVFPPSIHEGTGQEIMYQDCPVKGETTPGTPTKVSAELLNRQVGRLAAATLIARHWAKGSRQDCVMALAGGLALGGWKQDDAISFVEGVLEAAQDYEDRKTRIAAVELTYKKLDEDVPFTGWSRLAELTSPDLVGRVCEWLHLKSDQSPLITKGGKIFARKWSIKDGWVDTEIASFNMTPLRSVFVPGEGEYLDVKVTSIAKSFEIEIPPKAWASAGAFKKLLGDKGTKETIFLGTDNHTQLLRQFIGLQKMDHVAGTRTSGIHEGPNGLRFVTEEGAMGKTKGALVTDNDFVYLDLAKTNNTLISTEMMDEVLRKKLLTLLPNFNTPNIAMTLLGWTVACLYKTAIMKYKRGFPILIAEGAAGSGKSQSAKVVIMGIWGLAGTPKSVAEQTAFSLMKLVSVTNTIPVVTDENKSTRQTAKIQDRLSNLIRSLYDGIEGDRGQRDQSLVSYKHEAPFVVCGETGFNEAAIADRTISLEFASKTSRPHSAAFNELSKLDLGQLGKSLLGQRLGTTPEQIEAIYQEEYDKVDPRLEDRPRNNAAICRLGLRMLSTLVGDVFDYRAIDRATLGTIHLDFDPDTVNQKLVRKSEVSKVLEALSLIASFTDGTGSDTQYIYNYPLESGKHYKISDEGGELFLRIHVDSAISFFKKWAREYDYDGDVLGPREFHRQIRGEEYFVKKGAVNLAPGVVVSGVTLNLTLMGMKGLDLNGLWDPTAARE